MKNWKNIVKKAAVYMLVAGLLFTHVPHGQGGGNWGISTCAEEVIPNDTI